jgi:putative lipoic acid-binding regulatory protein
MKRLQIPLEASGARLEYPLDYGFTIIGLAADDFPEHARRLVARFVVDVPAEAVSVRSSAGGKYHSVSVSVQLQSEEQRRAVYQALHEDGRVVFVL